MGLSTETFLQHAARQEDRHLAGQILREAERQALPGPEAAAALDDIVQDRQAGPAFADLYKDEILQFWEGHGHEAQAQME